MVASLISMTLALGVGMIAPKVSIDAEKIVLLYYWTKEPLKLDPSIPFEPAPGQRCAGRNFQGMT